MSDLAPVSLNITAEYMSINSELQLFRSISGTALDGKIERSVYNKRKRKLFAYMEEIRKTLSSKFSNFTDVFIVDSTPIEICKISSARSSYLCSTEEIQPSFGYCAAQKTRFSDINYMLFVIKTGFSIHLIFHSPMYPM